MSKLYCVEVQKKRKGYTQDEMLKEERKKEIEKKKEKQTEKYMFRENIRNHLDLVKT